MKEKLPYEIVETYGHDPAKAEMALKFINDKLVALEKLEVRKEKEEDGFDS